MQKNKPKNKKAVGVDPGAAHALRLFHAAAEKTPAYKKFLRQHRVDPKRIRTAADFSAVPITDKPSYIYAHPLMQLFPDGAVPPMAYASSGSSGKPTFWFRGDAQERAGGELHRKIFKEAFNIDPKDSTLVIVSFSMGVWIAGGYTADCCRYVARSGFNLTTVTPGIEREDIFNIFRNMAPNFKNVIFAGYPPFLMNILTAAKRVGIVLPKKLFALSAGDKFSEEWRDAFLREAGGRPDPNRIINLYGSADAGVLGYETPATIFIRRAAAADPRLRAELFGSDATLPALFEYDPNHIYFETAGNELIFTADTAAPLIRYNIHDIGRVLGPREIDDIARRHGLQAEFKKRRQGKGDSGMPMVVKAGRTDVAVTFYALNIYPEHLRAITADRSVAKYLSGNFFASNEYVRQHRQEQLHLKFELSAGRRASRKILELVRAAAVRNLVKNNIEFRKLRDAIGSKSDPRIELAPHREKSLVSRAAGLLNIAGKKPTMVLKHK